MIYDATTKRIAQDLEKRVLNLYTRLNIEESKSGDRNGYAKDYARIIYSSSFLRLQGKMQLLAIEHTEFTRNRLTHSLTVAQVAREIAAQLGLKRPIVTECASLVHDIGNPPFGHSGERVLNKIAKNFGGFEGNAQTFRILNSLEKKHVEFGGLNLTLRTLLATVKYYRKFDNGENEKFVFDDDFDLIKQQLDENGLGNEPNTIDMQIMNKADEIAYAAHDLEDCLKLDYLTIDELLHEFKHHDEFSLSYKEFKKLVESCQKFAGKANRLKTLEEFSFLFRRRLTSVIVNTLVRDLHFSDENLTYNNYGNLSKGLKKLTFKAVKRKPSVILYEKMGEEILKGLFKVYSDKSFNKNLELLPAEYRKFDTESDCYRNIIDFISGMMDSFAIKEYEKYFGSESLKKQYFSSDNFDELFSSK